MTSPIATARTRHRERAPRRVPLPAGAAVALEQAAQAARSQPTVATAVRSAWDVLVTSPHGAEALEAWAASLYHDGPQEDLFPAACLASSAPSKVAATLIRAASVSQGRAA